MRSNQIRQTNFATFECAGDSRIRVRSWSSLVPGFAVAFSVELVGCPFPSCKLTSLPANAPCGTVALFAVVVSATDWTCLRLYIRYAPTMPANTMIARISHVKGRPLRRSRSCFVDAVSLKGAVVGNGSGARDLGDSGTRDFGAGGIPVSGLVEDSGSFCGVNSASDPVGGSSSNWVANLSSGRVGGSPSI